MSDRMNRKQISFGSGEEHDARERRYWKNASIKEKLEAITYLRECFYGEEATSGRLPRLFAFTKLT